MKRENNIMMSIASFIVDKRVIIYIFFAIAIVYSIMSVSKVNVINDITSYLPSNTETRQGLDIMEEEFTTYGTADVMVTNITYENGEHIADMIKKIDNIKDVEFKNDEQHYKNSAALLNVTFADDGSTKESEVALNNIKELLSEYDTYISTEVASEAQEAEDLNSQMKVILTVAALIIGLVLLFTSKFKKIRHSLS